MTEPPQDLMKSAEKSPAKLNSVLTSGRNHNLNSGQSDMTSQMSHARRQSYKNSDVQSQPRTTFNDENPTDIKMRKQISSLREETPMMTTNKFSNSYGFNFNQGQGVTSPRMTNTTQFGHANCNIPEEEQIDIEYSIEERIEENLSKLEKPQF